MGRRKLKRRVGAARRWIRRAIRRPGSLRRWLRGRGGRIVVGATKRKVWTKTGEINTTTLKKFTKTAAYQRLPARRKRQIRLAITLERLSKRRKA